MPPACRVHNHVNACLPPKNTLRSASLHRTQRYLEKIRLLDSLIYVWSDMDLKCPGCGSKDVRRLKREGLLERLLSRFLLAPFRCRSWRRCFHRQISPVPLPAMYTRGPLGG